MSDGFIRQRRNLLLSSIILFLISYAGITIENNLILFGNKFIIQDPIVIYITIWVMIFYFLIRYISYYNELNNDLKEYDFPNYPWHGNQESYFERKILSIHNFFQLFQLILLFFIHNSIQTINFLLQSISQKNFFETLFPILFAILIILLSYNAPFTIEKKQEAFNKISFFGNSIYEKSIGFVINDINDRIHNYKIDINDYSKDITGVKLFELKKINNE